MSAVTRPAGRYAENPRTPEYPMAFTRWEFRRGALFTYVSFVLASMALSVWAVVIGAFVALFWTAPIAFVTMVLVGGPLARFTGLQLVRETRTWVHLVAHACVGAVAGFAGLTIFLSLTSATGWGVGPIGLHLPDYASIAGFWWILVYPAITPLCAMWGWRFTSKRALAA